MYAEELKRREKEAKTAAPAAPKNAEKTTKESKAEKEGVKTGAVNRFYSGGSKTE